MRERELFELLVREHATALRVFVRGAVQDDHVADDVFQDALVHAWKSLDRYDRSRPFGRWLRGIAANLIREHRRQLVRRPKSMADDVLQVLDDHCEAFQSRRHDTLDDELASVRSCIDELPPHFRDAVLARYAEGTRGEDLARRLDITLENAKKRLQRARALLATCVQQSLGLTVRPSP